MGMPSRIWIRAARSPWTVCGATFGVLYGLKHDVPEVFLCLGKLGTPVRGRNCLHTASCKRRTPGPTTPAKGLTVNQFLFLCHFSYNKQHKVLHRNKTTQHNQIFQAVKRQAKALRTIHYVTGSTTFSVDFNTPCQVHHRVNWWNRHLQCSMPEVCF